MKFKLLAIGLAIIVTLGLFSFYQHNSIKKLKIEKQISDNNNETLLSDIEIFKTKDNKTVAQVHGLNLSLEQLEKYRKEDASLIKQLKKRNYELSRISDFNVKTKDSIIVNVVDSIVIRYVDKKAIIDTMYCFIYKNDFIYLDGCIKNNIFAGRFEAHNSYKLLVSSKYKRFWGFLWKTKNISDTHYQLVSDNPDTYIDNFEVVNVQ